MAMTIAQVDGSLVVIDRPVAHWLFYACFVAGGIAALYLSFFTPADTLSAAVGAVVGLGNIARTPDTAMFELLRRTIIFVLTMRPDEVIQ